MTPGPIGIVAATTGTHGWSSIDSVLVVVVVILVGLAAFLAYAETALVRTSKVRAAAMLDRGMTSAAILQRLVENPAGFLNPILLMTLVCQMVSATLLGIVAERVFGAIGVLVATVVEVLVVFVLGEALPKNISVRNPDKAALRSARLVTLIVRFPLVSALSSAVMALTRAVTQGSDELSSSVSEEELLAMADAAVEGEIIETNERELIHSVISFGDTVAREVMVPRPDVVAVSAEQTVDEVVDVILEAGISRVPVFEGEFDNVIGIAIAKDLLGAQRRSEDGAPIRNYIRKAWFVPETKAVASLLAEMKTDRYHLAVVVDEYGSITGLVTMEDLIEELVGDISDEYDDDDVQEMIELEGGEYKVAGHMPVDDLAEKLSIELPDGEWDSVAGMLIGLLGHIPEPGEEATTSGYRFIAETVLSRRIETVRVVPNFEE